MKRNNKKINAERDIQNEIGRKAVKRGIQLNDLDQLGNPAAQQSSPYGPPGPSQPAAKSAPKTPKTPKTPVAPKKEGSSDSTKPSTKRKSVSSARCGPPEEFRDDKDDSDEDDESPSKRPRQVARPRPSRQGRQTKKSGNGSQWTSSPGANVKPEGMNAATLNSLFDQAIAQGAVNPNWMGNMSSATYAAPQSYNAPLRMPTVPNTMGPTHTVNPAFLVRGPSQDMDRYPAFDRQLPMDPHGAAFVGNALGHPNNLGNSTREAGSFTTFGDAEKALENQYKATICQVLEVDAAVGEIYSLPELRTYARAYNAEYSYEEWSYHPDYLIHGFSIIKGGQHHCHHFAQAIPAFQALAVERGDLTPRHEFVPNAPGIGGFPRQTSTAVRQALGIAENIFGFHDTLLHL